MPMRVLIEVARSGECWGRMAEAVFGTDRSLRIMAALGVGAAVILVFSEAASWLVWPGAALTGLSVSSWNTVGMLAVIEEVPVTLAGRGSGVVLLGFLTGLGLGAPLMGWSVDVSGSYRPGWSVVGALFVVGYLVLRPRRS